ncbi:FecR family protein [Chitinophaga sp. Cy-1792]|uniref:FecR family protein n=1 Tax=Chitinophaga sp. Cy-1792 TaxID=2608339 RepID=UPI00141F1716|nr:FecR family protein [Chitinophaga sp. Cy-1792]NIG55867.1 FecR family protein [Chitinophaga sp. Cy-1792]
MQYDRINYLLQQYIAGNMNEQEQEELRLWMADDANEAAFVAVFSSMTTDPATIKPYDSQLETVLQQILASSHQITPSRTMRPYRWWAAAAAVALLIGGTWLLWPASPKHLPVAELAPKDIAPGHAGAILTLDDGSQVVLDSMGNGVVANQAGTQVVIKNGQLQYDATANNATVVYNTMTTPNGRVYTLMLPDGSRVWLNAASSLRFPTAFTDGHREVTLSGEAYFEVNANAHQPFTVVADNMKVAVLGTSFNIQAYKNEQVQATTLISGKVKVTADNETQTLQPGQQATLSDKLQVSTTADLYQSVAWKEGVFSFDGMSLPEAMRQIERWYNITVIYENGIPDIHFGGKVTRNASLHDLLHILSRAELKFRLTDNRLIIMK